MVALEILALLIGILWVVVGGGLVALSYVFKNGVCMGGGAGWSGVFFTVMLTMPGFMLITWSVL